MQEPAKQKLLQGICCLLSLAWVWPKIAGVEASEFSGGHVTGPLLTLANIGSVLLLFALLVTFVYPRIAASIAFAGLLFCLPLYLYFTAPGPFRRIFKGEYTVLLQASFVWDFWTIAGGLTLAGTAYVCYRGFRVISLGKARERRGVE